MQLRIAFLVFFLATSALAQNNFVYPVPEASRLSVTRDVAFGSAPSPLLYDFYRPAGDAVVPVVIFANVGSRAYRGWGIYQGWARAVTGEGMAAVIYDATPQTATADFDAIVESLRARADEYRIDPSRIVLWGASANVRVALPIAMDAKRDYIRGAVLYYGEGPVTEIRADLPVMFIRSGLDGTELNSAIDRLLMTAIAANAHWTIENYGGGVHAFDVLDDNEVSRELIRRTLHFMKAAARPDLTRAYALAADDARLGGDFARGDWSRAIAGYRQRLATRPDDGELHRKLGLSLLGAKQHAEALVELTKAWELGRRGTRDTVYPAARAAAGAGDIERTIRWLDLALSTPFAPPLDEIRASVDFAKVRDTDEFRTLLAEIEKERAMFTAFESGRGKEVVKELTSMKSGRLTREDVLTGIGYRLLQAGRHSESMDVFKIATKRYPRSANAWDSLSEAAEAAGAKSEALRHAKKALELLAKDSTLTDAARENIRRASATRVERLASM